MKEEVLELQDKIQDLITSFESANGVATTAISVNRTEEEETIGEPIITMHFIVPYTMER